MELTGGQSTRLPTGPFSIVPNIDPTNVPLNTYFAIYSQYHASGATALPRSRSWKLIKVVPPGGTTLDDLATPYFVRLPIWYPGDALFLRIIPISQDGFPGPKAQLTFYST